MPIIEEARDLVARRLDAVAEPDARLFTGPRGGRISTAVLRDATHWDDVVMRLGHEHLRWHDLRHTGLTWMEVSGVASSASFGSFGERALPGPQRVALRRSQRDGTRFSARDLGRQQQVASDAWMRHLIRLQEVTVCCSQGNVQERSEGRSGICPVAG